MDELRGEGVGVGQPGAGARRQLPAQGVAEAVREEGAEDRGADAAADLPEVVVGAGGGAEVGGPYGVLHGEDEHGHHHAEADAEDRHPDAVVRPGGVHLEAGEQPHADGRDGAAEHGVDLVAAGVADELPADDGGADDPGHHGQHQQPGPGGAGPVDHLQEGRQIAGGAEQGDTGHEAHQAADVEDGVAEQTQRDERFDGEAFGDEEEHDGGERAGAEAGDPPRVPGVLGAAPTRQQHQAGGGGGEQQRAEDVEATAAAAAGRLRQFQDEGDDGEGDQAEGDVDVEAPAPGEVVGEVAAEQRPGDGGETEGGADQAHVAAALPGRHDVGDDRLHADHEAARADALERAEGDQLVHRTRPAGERGADDEDGDGELEDALAAGEVAELAVERQADGGGEQIGGDRPGHPVQAVQFADDLRQRGRDDHLVEGREQQGQHQPGEHEPHAARAETGGLGGWGLGCSARRRERLVPHQSRPAHVPLPSSHLLTFPA